MATLTLIKGYADSTICEIKTTRRVLKKNEVLISISTAGLYGTDQHFRHINMALRHGVGVVVRLGLIVSKF